MPLDSATYDPVRDVIFGVRGGYLQEFTNAGVPTANRRRFCPVSICDSSIVKDAATDRLFIYLRYDPIGSAPSGLNGLYKINPATLAQESFDDSSTWHSYNVAFDQGQFGAVTTDDWRGRLIVAAGAIYAFDFNLPFKYATVPGIGLFQSGAVFTSSHWVEPAVNGTELWVPGPDSGRIQTFDLTTPEMQPGAQIIVAGADCWGMAITNTGRAYVVTRSIVIHRISQAHTVLADLLLPEVAATPFCARYNSHNGKVYVPGYASDHVYIIDPSTDAITTQFGFDSPFDIVFTPTKAFAVQHGMVGLKEVV